MIGSCLPALVIALALLPWVALAQTPAPQTASDGTARQSRMKVLLDTDIGTDIDDAWALGLLLASPDVDLVGVTISDGDTAARAKVAAKLLHRTGHAAVPLAVGRATPPPDSVDYQFTWAENFTALQPLTTPAADFIVDTLRRSPGEVTLVAVGP
jgi:purine nucleosidase